MVLPVYRGPPRGRLSLKAGLLAYDLLAGAAGLGWHRWLAVNELIAHAPTLHREGLVGG